MQTTPKKTTASNTSRFGMMPYALRPRAIRLAPRAGTMLRPGAIAPLELPFTLTFWKNVVGTALAGGEFEFTLIDIDNEDTIVDTAVNGADGLILFPLTLPAEGVYNLSISETSVPAVEGWVTDGAAYPVVITVTDDGEGNLSAVVDYPNGLPGFVNTLTPENNPNGLIQFPAQIFDVPGVYEFTLRELTPSGNGFEADTAEFPVVVTVANDGFGNLVASVEYPAGFPEFVNNFVLVPVSVVISATKVTVGAEQQSGVFTFGLFDSEGNLVATATNGSAT